MENPSLPLAPSATESLTMSNTPCGTHCQRSQFLGDKHPSWAAVFVSPGTHGLIQTADPAGCELFHHVEIHASSTSCTTQK